MIEARGLEKRYGSNTAVAGLDLQVRRGECLGLLGPNGAGKTTTIHMLVGVLRPDAGHVAIDGQRDATRPSVRRGVGIAPQSLALYDELTAEENLAFFGRIQGLRGGPLRDRVQWALGFAGLVDRAKDRVKTYSGGMKRRLNLASAVVHDPKVLLCDEPTVGVDPQSRNHIFDSIEALKEAGCTVLYTTHYMEEAERLCDRIAIMEAGRVLAVDTLDALLDEYGGKTLITVEPSGPLPEPPPAGASVEDGALRFESDEPFATLAQLGASGMEVDRMRVERPDLESVFLSLTGRSLRD